MPETKVLIADDEPRALEIIAKHLKNAGYKVVTAADGEEATVKISVESPDVIILDLVMPKKNGFEVLKDLRERPPLKDKWQPVIIVSAKGELEDLKKGFELEADHYITKPCNIESVISAIKQLVNLTPLHKLPGKE